MATQRKKLSVFAKEQGIAYITAYRHWQLGNIEGKQLPSGSILVSDWKDKDIQISDSLNVVIYARVPFSTQNQELKAQVTLLKSFAESKGYEIIDVVEEVGLGFSDHRTKFLSLLYRTDWNAMLVVDKERFASFGFPYIEALLRRQQQEIIVMDELAPSGDVDITNVPLTQEQQLITLVQRTRGALKTLIGMGSVKSAIETSINALLK